MHSYIAFVAIRHNKINLVAIFLRGIGFRAGDFYFPMSWWMKNRRLIEWSWWGSDPLPCPASEGVYNNNIWPCVGCSADQLGTQVFNEPLLAAFYPMLVPVNTRTVTTRSMRTGDHGWVTPRHWRNATARLRCSILRSRWTRLRCSWRTFLYWSPGWF